MKRSALLLCLLLLPGCATLGGGKPKAPPPDRVFAEDKLQHFFVSFIATSLAASGSRALGADRSTSLWIGAGTGAAAGAWKELNDKRTGRGTPSLLDFAWDLGGVGAATAVAAQAK